MMQLGYAELKEGVIRLTRLVDGGPLEDESLLHGILVSREDFDVHILDIPRVPAREIEGLIRFRLRTMYPGWPDETAFDYRLESEGLRQRALVFLSRRTVLHEYRAAANRTPLLLPCLLLEHLGRAQRDVRVWFCCREWAEISVFRGGALASCTLVRRKPGTADELPYAENNLPEEAHALPTLVVASKQEIDQLVSVQSARQPGTIRFLDFRELARVNRRLDGLFQEPRRSHPIIAPAVRIAGLSILVAVFGALLLFRQVWKTEDTSAKLMQTQTTMENRYRGIITMQSEVEALHAELAKWEATRPLDIYLLLSEVFRAVGSGIRIRSLQIREKGFQIEAVGSNPLGVMEALRKSTSFDAVKLSPVIHDERTGTERFALSGVFLAR